MIPVVLSGGSGTRLWPLSRTKLPKQFCDIFGESLLSMTIHRLMRIAPPWIITSEALRDLTVRESRLLSVPLDQLVFEPQARNTAPAIALLCAVLKKKGLCQEVVGIFPADHLIEKQEAFDLALQLAKTEAQNNKIVTLGIQPTFPATGYGYIQIADTPSHVAEGLKSFPVLRFHEKPDSSTAQKFLDSKRYFWNAGIFIFKVESMIEHLQFFQPKLWQTVESLEDDRSNLNQIYSEVESISIDYAIMEKLDGTHLSCIPVDLGWSDVGSWDAIEEILKEQKPLPLSVRSKGNFVFSNQDKHYAFIDTNETIVVDTKDAVLISKKGSTQSVKEVYEVIKKTFPQLADEHQFELRPWGKYEILKNTPHFKSKVIEVLSGQQLSYQSHTQREEHWIVTRGKGEVVLNDQIIPVAVGSYLKIPKGSKHRMRNTGDQTLEFIEVQLGAYFGEDDIKRYEDDYQRL